MLIPAYIAFLRPILPMLSLVGLSDKNHHLMIVIANLSSSCVMQTWIYRASKGLCWHVVEGDLLSMSPLITCGMEL